MNELKYTKSSEKLKIELEKKHQITQPLSCKIIPEGIVLPYMEKNNKIHGGVIDKEGEFVDFSNFNEKVGGAYSPHSVKDIKKRAIFIGGLVYSAWGHAITDDLKYFWWLLSNEFKRVQDEGDYVLVCIKSKFIKNLDTFSCLLSILNIDINYLLLIEEPTRFREVYVPESSFLATEDGKRFWSYEFESTINQIKDYFTLGTETFDKVYLSRTKIAGRRDFGEKYVEKAFKDANYHIVYPEEISLEQQIHILKNAKTVVTTEGSISHNAVFMQKHATLVILRKSDYINYYQVAINEMNDLNAVYIDAHLSVLNNKRTPIVGPFFIYVNRRVADFLGMKKSFPLFEFLRYIRWSLFHRDILDRIRFLC